MLLQGIRSAASAGDFRLTVLQRTDFDAAGYRIFSPLRNSDRKGRALSGMPPPRIQRTELIKQFARIHVWSTPRGVGILKARRA